MGRAGCAARGELPPAAGAGPLVNHGGNVGGSLRIGTAFSAFLPVHPFARTGTLSGHRATPSMINQLN
jgi:hypothetical protein